MKDRPVCGGSCRSVRRLTRVSSRCWNTTFVTDIALGFRLVALPGSPRVDRGGSWTHDPTVARVANRGRGAPGARNANLGFRLVGGT